MEAQFKEHPAQVGIVFFGSIAAISLLICLWASEIKLIPKSSEKDSRPKGKAQKIVDWVEKNVALRFKANFRKWYYAHLIFMIGAILTFLKLLM